MLPDKIIVYRDGVGDGQLPIVQTYEVKQLQECFPLLGQDYAPKLCVIVVQKRITQRMFAIKVCAVVWCELPLPEKNSGRKGTKNLKSWISY